MKQLAAFRADLFAGKSAVIAGGTSGINLAIAQGLAGLGARVAVLGRDPVKAQAAASTLGPRALALSADVRDFAAMEAAFATAAEAFGQIDQVIAGAAGNFVAPVSRLSANGFRTVVDIDLNGSFNTLKASYPYLKRPGASLIAISAGQALRPAWGQAHASAAKAGVEALVRTLSIEWGPEGIRVNSLCPGPIAGTEGVSRLMSPERQTLIADALPAGRMGQGADVAGAAAFLLSDAASYVTGTTLFCDGGLQLIGYDGRDA